MPKSPIEFAASLSCPLLGLFGNDDARPSPDEVNKTEEVLKQHNKVYQFHRYDNAGHGFFAVDRPSYAQVAATEGWEKALAWYNKYLSNDAASDGRTAGEARAAIRA